MVTLNCAKHIVEKVHFQSGGSEWFEEAGWVE